MTGIRRVLILIGLTLAVTVGAAIPASATFGETVALPKTAVTSATVQAPTNVSTAGTRCAYWTTYDAYGNPVYNSELRVRLSWGAGSTTARHGIAGYSVTAVMPDGARFPVGFVGNVTSLARNFPIQYAYAGIRVIVTTSTSFGWSADSAQSAVISC